MILVKVITRFLKDIRPVFPSHRRIVWYVLSRAAVTCSPFPCSLLRAFRPGCGSRILRQRCTITPVHLRVLSASRTIYSEITLSLFHIPCRSYHHHIFLYLSATHLIIMVGWFIKLFCSVDSPRFRSYGFNRYSTFVRDIKIPGLIPLDEWPNRRISLS